MSGGRGAGSGSGTDDGVTPGLSTLTREEVYEILAHPRRRYVVAALGEDGADLSLDELSRYVASREYETLADDLPTQTLEQVSTSLYHAHLPKLTGTGVVEYDRVQRRVSPTPDTERVTRVLNAVDKAVVSDD